MNDKPTETHPYTMNTDHTEVYIASLEKEIALERKNVEGSDQHPNFGEDFADLLFVTRQLKNRLDEANKELELLRPIAEAQYNSYETAARLRKELDAANKDMELIMPTNDHIPDVGKMVEDPKWLPVITHWLKVESPHP